MTGREQDTRPYALLLRGLLGLFLLRVLAQLLQALYPVTWLPGFDRWQGSNLPYPLLLASQLLIVLVVALIAARIADGRLVPNPRLGRLLLAFGALYFAVMAARLLLGLTLLSTVAWFATPLPAFFHLVLASLVLLIGHYHWRFARGARPA